MNDDNGDTSTIIIEPNNISILNFWIKIFDFNSENRLFFTDICSLNLVIQ